MKNSILTCISLAWLLFIPAVALAIGGDHLPGDITKGYKKEWPAGLSELINSTEWKHGNWVNQNDFFYYAGEPTALNAFLKQYGSLSNTPLSVVIHTGTKPLIGPLGKEQKTPYNWKLEIMRRGWGAPKDPRQPEKEPGYVVTVHIWLGDGMTLANLEIPKHIEVRSGGEIEQFIQEHRRPK